MLFILVVVITMILVGGVLIYLSSKEEKERARKERVAMGNYKSKDLHYDPLSVDEDIWLPTMGRPYRKDEPIPQVDTMMVFTSVNQPSSYLEVQTPTPSHSHTSTYDAPSSYSYDSGSSGGDSYGGSSDSGGGGDCGGSSGCD